MARAYPNVVREVHAAGHTIGTHSQNHPLTFDRMAVARAEQEIDDGIASVKAALPDPEAIAPFFRIPGLLRADAVERSLAARSLMTWSADVPGDDWRHIKAAEIVRRTITRLEGKRKGIVLLHDIQPATALALPLLLEELKERGYRLVHVVPAGESMRVAGDPAQWRLRGVRVALADQGWPRLPDMDAGARAASLSTPDAVVFEWKQIASPTVVPARRGRSVASLSQPAWPNGTAAPDIDAEASLPAPDAQAFGAADADGMPQMIAIAASPGFPAAKLRPRTHGAGKDAARAPARRVAAQSEAAPRSILDLLRRRPDAAHKPARPKPRLISSLPHTPQP
jgi:hypothetical protein